MLRAPSKSYSQQKHKKKAALNSETEESNKHRQCHNKSSTIIVKEISSASISAGSSTIVHYKNEDCFSNSVATYTCHNSTNFLPITVTVFIYLICLPINSSIVHGAPSPWGDACGIYIQDEGYSSQGPLHGLERNRALCELRGNLSKQIVSLRRFMGPRNFSKMWGKHNNSYAFLKVANEKNITLRTWHKQLQVYVVAADRLYEHAYKYKKLQETAWISSKDHIDKAENDLKRLRHLIITTRSILCDLELTANLLTKPQKSEKTFTLDKANMRAKILLKSDKRTSEESVSPLDINMLYQRLRRSLLQMRKPLKSHCIKSRRKKKHVVAMNRDSNVNRVDKILERETVCGVDVSIDDIENWNNDQIPEGGEDCKVSDNDNKESAIEQDMQRQKISETSP
ncbi:uncharacterized protein [Eurosta solidaginis]|uniref:uncharacterized protein n=1 Tax=Eurosta solidaginis TaxID=178769 RepID=UPI003530FE93